MTSHDSTTLTPPPRPARPRLSRGISSRRPQPPPVPPSLRDHPLLDAVAHACSSSASSSSCSSANTPVQPTRSHSRRSSLSTSSPLTRPADTIPLPSPTGLWSLPPRPSPPIGGPWSAPGGAEPEPVGDAMGLLDTVPAGSTVSAASPMGYPWHAAGGGARSRYDYISMQLNSPAYALHPVAGTKRPAGTEPKRSSPSKQRHNVGTLHTHSPQPSPPVTPAAA